MPPFTKREIARLFAKSSEEDIQDILEDANRMLDTFDKKFKRKRKADGTYESFNSKEKAQLNAMINEFANSAFKPYDINTTELSRENVARARLIKLHMKHYEKLSPDEFDAELRRPLKYKDGTIKSLAEDFGEFDRNESDADMGVFRKGNKVNLTFRGSKDITLIGTNKTANDDWAFNVKGFFKSQKGSPEYNSLDSRVEGLKSKFGDDIHINGYSKGGGLGLPIAEKHGLRSTAFNPSINATHDLHNYVGDHHIIRTPGDPATMLLGFKGKNPETKISVLPQLKYADNPVREHSLSNFTDDINPRSKNVNLVTELQAHAQLVHMHNELTHADSLLRDPKKLMIHAAKKLKLISQGKRPSGVFTPDEQGQEMTTTREQPLRRPEFEDPRAGRRTTLRTTSDLEPQVPIRPEQRLSRPRDTDFDMNRRLRTTSDTRSVQSFEIESLNASVQQPNNISQVKPLTRIQKAVLGQLEEGVIEKGKGKILEFIRGVRGSKEPATDRNFRLVNEALGDSSPLQSTDVQRALLEADPEAPGGLINEKTMNRFVNSSTTTRKNIITEMGKRVTQHANMLNEDYLTRYKEASLAGRMGIKAVPATLRSGVAGIAAGALAGAVMDKLNISHEMNPEAATFVTGTVAGAAGELAAMKAAGMMAKASPSISKDMATALLSKAGATRLLSGGLSAGVGALAGYATTEAIRDDFSQDADPYVKDITSEVVGGVVGTGVGVATGAALTAGAAAATGGLEAAAASVEFPPLALAFLLGSGISVIAGSIIGSQEAAEEVRQKALTEQKAKAERIEGRRIEQAGNIVSVNEQYDKMISYLKSIGASNETISKVINDKMHELSTTKGTEPLTQEEFQNKMQHYMNEYGVGEPTGLNREDLQGTLATQYQVRASRMAFLINKLNQAGIEVPVPSSNAYVDSQNYSAAYNDILASIPASERKNLGLDFLPPVYQNSFKTTSVNPDDASGGVKADVEALQVRENARDTLDFYKNHPNLAALHQDEIDQAEFDLNPTGYEWDEIGEGLQEAGQAISSAFQSVGSAITSIFTPQNVPKPAQQANASNQAAQATTSQNVGTASTPKPQPTPTQPAKPPTLTPQQAYDQKYGTFWQQFTGQLTPQQQANIQASHNKNK